jgi:8-oxo-dGTP pyrophosphatase MutT (NUDIX family)
MTNTIKQAGVVLIVDSRAGEVLAITRKNDDSILSLPGGKVDYGESPVKAAIRECFEETGVQVLSCIKIYKNNVPAISENGESFYTSCFLALSTVGEVKQQPGEGKPCWVASEKLTGVSGAFPIYNSKVFEAVSQLNRIFYPPFKIK